MVMPFSPLADATSGAEEPYAMVCDSGWVVNVGATHEAPSMAFVAEI
jgi:hypothetical protein